MLLIKQFSVLCFLLLSFNLSQAQIEVAHVSAKDYNAFGYGAFLNFNVTVSEVNYITLEGGIQYFKDKNTDELTLVSFLGGYRYTLNQSGAGFYVEPTAGYTFSNADYDEDNGISAVVGVGYIFAIANIPFSFGLRYLHTFDHIKANAISFRISHPLTFGRRNNN